MQDAGADNAASNTTPRTVVDPSQSEEQKMERVDANGDHSTLSTSQVIPSTADPSRTSNGPAPMRNLYTASMSYNGYTITDGALRLIILLHANELGFNAIEIAFMFSMYEVAGVFTNLFGGVAGSKYGLRCTLLSSLFLQIACLVALTQTENVVGKLSNATSGSRSYLEATIYITLWQTLAGVAKDLMKLTGKSTPKLVTKEGQEGKLFRIVARVTGMKNALKGLGQFLGALLVAFIGWQSSLLVLVVICVVFIPVAFMYMDSGLGKSRVKKIDWGGLFSKGRQVNLLSGARFFLFASRDIWFEIGLPLFLRDGLGWNQAFVGLFMAGILVVYGNLQTATTGLYKKKDGTTEQPTGRSAAIWAAWCSIIPLFTGIASYCTYILAESEAATVAVLAVGLVTYSSVFAVNSSVHSYLIVSYSSKDKVSVDLGFYYMANAMGRLVGTLGGGFLYHYTFEDFGLSIALLVACPFLLLAALVASNLKATAPGLGPKSASINAVAKENDVIVRQVDEPATDIHTTATESDVGRVTEGRDVESQDAAR